jgi:hypothetical protein
MALALALAFRFILAYSLLQTRGFYQPNFCISRSHERTLHVVYLSKVSDVILTKLSRHVQIAKKPEIETAEH